MTVVDDMRVGIDGWGLGGGSDMRRGCGWFIRNLEMLSSRVSEVLISCARIPVDCCWRTVVSSSFSSEGKKSDGWFEGVLGGNSGWEGSHQLGLFKVEMVAVCEGTILIGKLDLLLCLILGKEQA